MKTILLLIAMPLCYSSYAQHVTIKKDTIFNGKIPVALIAERQDVIVRYQISSFVGDPLIRISGARTDLDGKPAYVINFLNNRKKAMVAAAKVPNDIVKEIVYGHVITRAGAIDTLAENIFIKNHPLPAGYTDVNRPMEPGRKIRVPKK